MFLSKLEELSIGRDLYPWLISLGFTHATINRLKKGQSPSADLLRALQRTERISTRWLEDGKGSPYLIDKVVNDAEAKELLDDLFVEDWAALLATADDKQFTVVLHQPGAYKYKENNIEYRIVEVVAGGITIETVKWLVDSSRITDMLRLDENEMHRLSAGNMGNMEIFGWEDARKKSKGIVDNGTKLKSMLHDSPYMALYPQGKEEGMVFGIEEKSNVHQLHTLEIMHGEEGENAFLRRYRQLKPVQQEALLVIMEGLVNPD